MSLRLVSAPLEVFTGPADKEAVVSHNIVSDHPHTAPARQVPISANCYTDHALVLVTTPDPAHNALHLRTLYRSSSKRNPPIHEFLFPAPILDSIFLGALPDDNTVLLQVCTLSGFIYRLLLPLNLLDSVDELPARWTREYRFGSLSQSPHDTCEQGVLTSFHTSQDGRFALVACNDGRVLKAVWEEDKPPSDSLQGSWLESVLRPDTFFSRLFGRPSAVHGSPQQVLSLATYSHTTHRNQEHSLCFTVTRDRKVRIWDLDNDTCLQLLDLPSSPGDQRENQISSQAVASSANSEEGAKSGTLLFNGDPQLQLFTSGYELFVIVYIPAPLPSGSFFAIFSVQISSSAQSSRSAALSIGQARLVWEKECDKETRGWNAELHDMKIVAGTSGAWSLWTLWDVAGTTLLKRIEGLSSSDGWESISTLQSYSPLHGSALDEDLKAVTRAEEIPEFFMRKIVEPGRISRTSLEEALVDYEEALVERYGMLPNVASSSNTPSIRDRICSVVGCTVELQEEETTGALLHSAHWSDMLKEWTTFINLAEDHEAKERWPIQLVAPVPELQEPYVVSRGRIAVPVIEDAASRSLRELLKGGSSGETQQDEAREVLGFSARLFRAVHPSALDGFERELLKVIETQSSIPPEVAADLLWTSQLQGSISDEEILEEEFALLCADVKDGMMQALHLIRHSDPQAQSSASNNSFTQLENALCADALTQMTSDRLLLARMLTILAVAITAGFLPFEESFEVGPSIEELLGDIMASYHRLYAFDILARRDGIVETLDSEPSSDDDGRTDAETMVQTMENLQFDSRAKEPTDSGLAVSASHLVHACVIRGQLGMASFSSTGSLAERIYRSAQSALYDYFSAETAQSLQPIELTPKLAAFAGDILKAGNPSAAAAFVELFPRTPASHYLLARSHILNFENEAASEAFTRVVPAFCRLEEEHSDARSGLMDIMPPAVRWAKTTDEALFHYYKLVVSYYQQQKGSSPSPFFIASYAKKALEAASSLSGCDTRTLQEARFRCLLALEWYEDAYTHLIAIPFADEQKRLLPDLISRMCEQGQVDALLSLNFAGLQVEVVSTLSFKARNSRTLDEIDFYFDLLYSFYVKRGDLKNAGATMWQMGTRLREIAKALAKGLSSMEDRHVEQIQHLSIMEARAYLACINVLSQLDERDAWFAHDTGGVEEEENMESKLTKFVPLSCFIGKGRDNLRIVELDDIRRRYQVRLAQLELFAIHSHYPTSILTIDQNDANNAVSLFASNDDFDRAFALARMLKLDRTQIYATLTDRCLELSRRELARKKEADEEGWSEHPLLKALLDDEQGGMHETNGLERGGSFLARIDRCTTWNGSATQRAWRYLQEWLDMEPSKISCGEERASTDPNERSRYHLVVLERILHWQQWEATPVWLLTWLHSEEQEPLVRSLLSYDLLDGALKATLQMVSRATSTVRDASSAVTLRKRKHAGLSSDVYLPYLLLDELLKRAEESSLAATTTTTPISSSSGSLIERRTLAKRLREAIEAHKEQLRKVQTQQLRQHDEDEKRKRRYEERRQEDVTMEA